MCYSCSGRKQNVLLWKNNEKDFTMGKKILFAALLSACACASFAEVFLMKGGKSFSSIVLDEKSSVVEKYAAEELSTYLGKIAGGDAPTVGTAPVAGKYPIYLKVSKDPSMKDESFRITVKKDSLTITGKEPVGVLYGAYAILKKYGGIRWLLPGKEGEYFKVKPDIVLPEKSWEESPSFPWRDFQVVCTGFSGVPVTRVWGMRNNMRFHVEPGTIRKDKLEKLAPIQCKGGHSFSPLLHHWFTKEYLKSAKTYREYCEKQFKEHPEYYPFVRGKRVKSFDGGNKPQPCTTNPDVIRIMGRELGEACKSMDKDHIFYLGNNDCTQWCQCENCRKVDPEDEAEANLVATRYWTFAKALLDEAQKVCPDLKVLGSSYQNFSMPPTGTKVDKRVKLVSLANLRRCWKHALDDRNCPTNCWFYKYNKVWNDFEIPCRPYEMFTQAGKEFMPNERKVVEALKYYRKNMPHIIGLNSEVCPPDGIYGKRWKTYGVLNNWRMMWQTMYLSALFHWDVEKDFEKEYEEINSLFYGKGWEGGMREFRKELEKLYLNSGGCWGYGSCSPLGKLLDVPGAAEKLLFLLDKAEKAAEKDPDPRALANVKKDREFFQKIWMGAYEEFTKNYREIKAYPLQGKIVIDGKLDEPDWKSADTVTRFTNVFKKGTPKHQTGVKLAYDKQNLYIGIECLEPLVDEMLAYYKKHDDPVWNDNDVELFINDPILGRSYFQFVINSDGVLCDGIANPNFSKDFDSGAEVKTSKGKDRYFVEIRIPAKSIIGGTFQPGTVLKMNVVRCRVIKDRKEETEASSWSMGQPHNVDVFHAVNFSRPRSVDAGSRANLDTRGWRNGSFDEFTEKERVPKHWKVNGKKLPASWILSTSAQYGGDMEYLLHEGTQGNYFVRLRKGIIHNKTNLKAEKLFGSCRLRGKGSLRISVLRYTPKYKHLGTETLAVFDVDGKDWKQYSFQYKRAGAKNENQFVILWAQKDCCIDIDDFYLVPEREENTSEKKNTTKDKK